MTMTDKTGGAAFPFFRNFQSGETEMSDGMTLRDYFAAAALSGLVVAAVNEADSIKEIQGALQSSDLIAGMAYEIADALLKARET